MGGAHSSGSETVEEGTVRWSGEAPAPGSSCTRGIDTYPMRQDIWDLRDTFSVQTLNFHSFN